MAHQFSQVPTANIPRSSFKRDHGYKTTFDAGYLVPFLCDEALPGDTFSVNSNMFARLATPIVPIMDNMHLETFYFAVPLRLLWDNFQRFMGEQDNPEDSTDYTVPQVNPVYAFGWQPGGLSDYFGLPIGVENPPTVSAFWHRAYNLIYNEWFRDQNLQDSVNVPKGDGPDPEPNYQLLRRGKRHDYFTSALPWPQKGAGVELPLGNTAEILTNNQNILFQTEGGGSVDETKITLSSGSAINAPYDSIEGDAPTVGQSFSDSVLRFGSETGLQADLSGATSATINSLREAFQLQRMLERDARGGTRYTEIIRAHFRVQSPDARLQRPEYLGGGKTPVIINPVAQTNSTDATTPQGNLAAFGTVASTRNGFTKSFTEHCVIIGLLSVNADLTYQQGTPRMWNRKSKYDFYWPALAHLGEQAVLNQEIYTQDADTLGPDNETPINEYPFGYQERWAEYRYKPSLITGKMRSSDPQSLDVWHLSQNFANLPTLSSTFIEDTPPVDRVIAVQDEPHFILDTFIQMNCARPMPVTSVPGMMDHF